MWHKLFCFIGWHCDHAIASSKDKYVIEHGWLCHRVSNTYRHVECCRCGSSCWVRITFNT